jgi:hypothetical protein
VNSFPQISEIWEAYLKLTSCSLRAVGGLWLLVLPLIGWTLPGSYKAYDVVPARSLASLSHVVVEVNGQRVLVNSGDLFTVVQGDSVLIVNAIMTDRRILPEHVNLIGFSADKSKLSEDRGVAFSTAKGFEPEWTVDDGKSIYAIAVTTKKRLHGAIFMKIAKPQLKFVDVLVNEKVRVMREGEVLVLGAKDKIQVQKVVTNLEKNEDVNFEIIKTGNNELEKTHLRQATAYEIRFSRQGQVFAKIPMLIEGL